MVIQKFKTSTFLFIYLFFKILKLRFISKIKYTSHTHLNPKLLFRGKIELIVILGKEKGKVLGYEVRDVKLH
jgi:hypothetical protein